MRAKGRWQWPVDWRRKGVKGYSARRYATEADALKAAQCIAGNMGDKYPLLQPELTAEDNWRLIVPCSRLCYQVRSCAACLERWLHRYDGAVPFRVEYVDMPYLPGIRA